MHLISYFNQFVCLFCLLEFQNSTWVHVRLYIPSVPIHSGKQRANVQIPNTSSLCSWTVVLALAAFCMGAHTHRHTRMHAHTSSCTTSHPLPTGSPTLCIERQLIAFLSQVKSSLVHQVSDRWALLSHLSQLKKGNVDEGSGCHSWGSGQCCCWWTTRTQLRPFFMDFPLQYIFLSPSHFNLSPYCWNVQVNIQQSPLVDELWMGGVRWILTFDSL